MNDVARRGWATAAAVFETARNAQLTFLAAAIAYYAFVSIVPLLALVVVLSTAIGGEALVQEALDRTDTVLTDQTQELLFNALLNQQGRIGATAFGTVAVSWSALRVFRGLDIAFSEIYGSAEEATFLSTVRDGLTVTVAIFVGLIAMTGIVFGVGLLPLGPFAPLVAVLLGVLTLTVLFLPMYYVFPDRPIDVGEAAPGAVTAALGWMLLAAGFSVYVDVATGVTVYGVLGGVFLLVTFLYFGALIVVVGAVVNVTLGSDRQLQQGSSPGPGLTRTMPASKDDTPADEEASPESGGADGEDDATQEAVGPEAAEFDPGERTPEEARLREEVAELRAELDDFRDDVEGRTVDRDEVEGDLKRYVRRRVRRGHARGWGPYLVLLYGTAMTIGAFYYLSSGWAILAMFVVWLSTLGLYVLMVLVGAGLSLLGLPGRLRDRIGEWRS
ncbi:hypothetical protein L593_05770 [Salinarchaeum sp. Harcht-Bsk1]|uniref:YihY/virulence factor BrkB family protein n=1 Tax=Salinarchaeum sp. Harcht-Bsk1 TaxID=1333523 RepID=UPI0003422F15|nr:YihY/virulence factor BrkB family protein [Salinarchaeum sp. Harcht-Bsk1]AGN01103.1 hypothetical protein L593_05770 [Salinarchaeum sp. Harcht-Bsk1]